MNRLDGQRAIVTGAVRGIGRAIADLLAEQGCRVAICDIDAAVLGPLGPLRGYQCDIGDPADSAGFVRQAIGDLGGVDILVNNAGIAGPTGRIEELDTDGWRQCFAVNLDSAFYCCRAVLPAFRSQGHGCIVNIASTAGRTAYALRTPYAAAKWGLIGLTKSLAMEAGPAGVRVNAVCPGTVEGPRMDGVIAREATARGVAPARVREAYRSQSSLRSFIEPGDIAEAVAFLCSPAARRINGEVISVDGHLESVAMPDLADGGG